MLRNPRKSRLAATEKMHLAGEKGRNCLPRQGQHGPHRRPHIQQDDAHLLHSGFPNGMETHSGLAILMSGYRNAVHRMQLIGVASSRGSSSCALGFRGAELTVTLSVLGAIEALPWLH